jgi:outer membrane protein assembly factor BamC
MRFNRQLVVILSVIALTACSFGKDKRPEYQGAEYYKSLEYPPELTLVKSTADLEIPEPTESALTDFRRKHMLDNAVTPEFKGIRLMHEGSLYFLEVDASPEVVWGKIEAFWEHEGIKLQDNRPELGFMQTDWTKALQYKADAGFLKRTFSKIEPDFRDRFRLRVEPADDRTKSHIFVAHYGIEIFVEGGDDDARTSWRGRKSDVELEREILSRLTLFAGLSDNQAEALLREYKPFQSYVTYKESFTADDIDPQAQSSLETRVAVLSMKGSMDFVWYRTIRALDRIEAEQMSLDKKKGRISFVVPATARLTDTGEDIDELSESSWLMNLFRGKEEVKSEAYVLQLTEMQDYVDFVLLDDRGMEATTARAAQVRAAIARALD